ncbi:YheC/YheD family protein [Bacillus alkalicellulosilyticus]|uniref:YheC/YheD family endospore coat-associated protein n=1 Tax=Alkalihalobacterium alkalicellulosilyticum TaxID=1912214 RepID=UPI000996E296|nr:YheC/YheD family protein [Bacillus alkalicellulosilyticus]
MISLGVLLTHRNQETLLIQELAIQAKAYDIQICRFTPKDVSIKKAMIQGQYYHHDLASWINAALPLPDIIYDRCYHITDKSKTLPLVANLKKMIPFIGYGLPNKWEVYKALRGHPTLHSVLPETEQIKSFDDIVSFLGRHKKCIIKPLSGAQGKGIYVIEKNEDTMVVLKQSQQTGMTMKANEFSLKQWYERKQIGYTYLIQPFLPLKTHDNHPFDLRMYVNKNSNGTWIESAKAVRINKHHPFLSNLAQGGSLMTFDSFISNWAKEKQQQCIENLTLIQRLVPQLLEEHFLPLFEIGIDIGIDDDQKPWILEVNSKPGRKILYSNSNNTLKKYASNLLQYSLFVSNQKERLIYRGVN